MTDFLTRMVQRTLGLLPLVQPLITPKYAPEPLLTSAPELSTSSLLSITVADSEGATQPDALAPTPQHTQKTPVQALPQTPAQVMLETSTTVPSETHTPHMQKTERGQETIRAKTWQEQVTLFSLGTEMKTQITIRQEQGTTPSSLERVQEEIIGHSLAAPRQETSAYPHPSQLPAGSRENFIVQNTISSPISATHHHLKSDHAPQHPLAQEQVTVLTPGPDGNASATQEHITTINALPLSSTGTQIAASNSIPTAGTYTEVNAVAALGIDEATESSTSEYVTLAGETNIPRTAVLVPQPEDAGLQEQPSIPFNWTRSGEIPRLARGRDREDDESSSSSSIKQDALPTVRVTIGRIDVRALSTPTAAPPQPAAKASKTRTTLSLDEYLKQRNGERP